MSRTLRRPMFRGGRVSSYGTGIASGLADGGMPNRRGLVTGPGGYAGWEDRGTGYGGTGSMILGSDLMNFVQQNPKYGSLQFANTLNPRQYYNKPSGTYEIGRGGPKIENTPEFLKLWQNYMDPETTLIDPDKIDVKTGEVTGSVSGDSISGSEGEISTTVDKVDKVDDINIDTSLVDKKVLEIQNSDDAELSLEDIKEALGGKKAKGRDVTDMLLRFAGSEGADTMEKFQNFAKLEAAAGPSRTEKINEAAATYMLKDKFQSKRDKANIEMLKTKIDYSIAAGKNISISEAVLAATKGTNYSDKKLANAIQTHTSEATGERGKFAGTTDMAGLKAAMKSGDLTAGDTVIVTEKIEVEGQPPQTIKKIIEIQLIDGKVILKEIYRV